MKDIADDLAFIVRNAIAYIKELERQIHELKREASAERNFCPRCGKRTNDIHTCTPP